MPWPFGNDPVRGRPSANRVARSRHRPGSLLVLAALARAASAADLQQAVADLNAGRLPDAERALAALAQSQPASPDAHYFLGVTRFRQGRLAEAIPPLQEAVRLAPRRAAAWKALGVAFAARGDYASAELPFTQACTLDVAEPDACYYLARNRYAANQFLPSLEALARVPVGDPRPWRIAQAKGQALEALGRAEEAEQEFRRALRLHAAAPVALRSRPDEDPRLHYGVFLFRQGRTVEATAPLEDLVAQHPSASRARLELGRTLLQRSQPDAALPHLEAAVRTDPVNTAARLLLAKCYQRLGRAGDASRELERMPAAPPP